MTLSPHDVAEAEAPFRAPEQLALAMPLIAVSALIVVVSAVALGASGPVVAILAVVGFGLCAVAPMALIEAYVSRPLRGALAQLRAARDGRSEGGPAFASGALADLVHIARDLQAAQANAGAESLSPFEALVGAGEEAARALRLQAESVAEAAADGESQINRAAQACFADIAQAIKSMRDAPVAAGFDGAVERLESMLVYIAETQERAEAKDRQFESAFVRVEAGMADLARFVARESETVQGALSSHGLLARNDIADALAQEKGGRARVLERLDTLEARLAKGAEGAAAEVARLAEAIRADIARRPSGDVKLDDIAAALSRLARDFAAREPIDATLRGVSETLEACFQQADFTGLRTDVRETAVAVAAQVDTLRAPAGLDRSDLSAALADTAAELSRQMADLGEHLAAGRGEEARELAEAARGLIETTACLEAQAREGAATGFDGIGERLDALGARVEERLRTQGREHDKAFREAVAGTPEALERLGVELQAFAHAVEAREGRLESQTSDAFTLASGDLGAVAQRLEAALARLAAQGEEERRLAETVESALADVAARTESAALRQGERLDDFAKQTVVPARDALAGATREFAAVRARFEAGEPALARVFEATQGARAQIDALAESLPRAFAATAEAQAERLLARLDAAALMPAREALAQSTESFAAAQGRLAEIAVRLEAGDPRLASVAGKTEAIRSQIDGLALAMRAQADGLAVRLDAAVLAPARDALAQAADGFGAAQERLAEAAAKIEAGDPGLAALAEAMRAQGDELVSRLDVAALTPARDAFMLATQSFDAAQARLTEAAAKVEAGDPRIALVADAAKALHVEFAAMAQNLPDALAEVVGAGGIAPARDALAQAARAFDSARSRLDDGAQSLAQLRGDFVASEARFGRMLEETVARMAALGFDRLPDLMGDLAATQAQWRAQLGEFERSAGALACLANADARDVAALRVAFEAAEQNLRAAIVDLAPGVEAAAAQGGRIMSAMETRDRKGALELGQAVAGLSELHARLEPALARAPDGFDALRADLAASAQTVASRFDAAALTMTRQIEDRVESLRRGEFAPAALALQASTQDLGKAQAELFAQVDALKASLAGDRSAVDTLREDLVQAFATVAGLGERADTLAARVGELAGAERAELAGLAQALVRIGERVEYAARAFEDRRGSDIATLGADLTRDIDALARATAERVLALEGGVETLAHAAGATLSQVREATRALRGTGLDALASRLDPLAELPALGARLARTLEAVERRLPAQTGGAHSMGSESAGALAALVASMADALDARFSDIEAGLADLGARLIGGDHDRLDANVAALAAQLNAASRALKTGLADFGGVSAALVDATSARAPTSTSGAKRGEDLAQRDDTVPLALANRI